MNKVGVCGTLIFGALLSSCSDQKPATSAGGEQNESSYDSGNRLKSELDMGDAPIAKLADLRVHALTADKIERVKKTLAQFTESDVEEIKKRGRFGVMRFGKFKTPAFDASEMIYLYDEGQSIKLLDLNYTLSYAALKRYLLAIPVQAANDPSVKLAKAFENKLHSMIKKIRLPEWISEVDTYGLDSDAKRACVIKGIEALAQVDLTSIPEKSFTELTISPDLDSEPYVWVTSETLWINCRSTAAAISDFVRNLPDFVPVEEN